MERVLIHCRENRTEHLLDFGLTWLVILDRRYHWSLGQHGSMSGIAAVDGKGLPDSE
jgi:hypothetical protein